MDSDSVYEEVRKEMSLSGSAIRNLDAMRKALSTVDCYLSSFSSIKATSEGRIWSLFQLRNALITQKVYLSAMIDYVEKGGESRGSALYSDEKGEVKPRNLDHRFIYSLEKEEKRPQIQEVKYEKGNVVFSYRDARPIPEDDDFFENVWSQYRRNRNIY